MVLIDFRELLVDPWELELKETLLQCVVHKSQIKMIRNTTNLLLVILVPVFVITVNTVAQYPAQSCTHIASNTIYFNDFVTDILYILKQ